MRSRVDAGRPEDMESRHPSISVAHTGAVLWGQAVRLCWLPSPNAGGHPTCPPASVLVVRYSIDHKTNSYTHVVHFFKQGHPVCIAISFVFFTQGPA